VLPTRLLRNRPIYVYLLILTLWACCPNLARAQLKLSIHGVPAELSDNVRLHLSRWEKLPSGSEDSVRKTIEAAVTKSLQPLGYYQPQIEITISEDQLNLNIEAGNPVTWGSTDIQIPTPAQAFNESLQTLLSKPPFPPGESINHEHYDDYKKKVLLSVRRQGYLDATWSKSRLQINLDTNLANVILHLSLGTRYRIDHITISGSELSDKTTLQLIDAQPGDWYSADNIGVIYDNLLSSGYFSNAIIDVETNPPDSANLQVELTDQPTDQFSTGLGYGTDTGARGKLGWTRSRLNHRGDSLYTNLQVSQIGQEVTAQYQIPWPHPLQRYISWDTGWKREETTDRETTLLSTGISFNRSQRKRWQYSAGINLENEVYQQGDNPEETITYFLPNFHYLERLILGNHYDPDAILRFWFDSSLGFSVVSNHALFLSSNIGASYSTDFNERHGMAARFELGGIMTDNFYSIPISKRFYTGGDQTVRGYKYNSIAPVDDNNELIGGQFLNVFSLEYRYQLAENWKLAAFTDTGRTYISSHDPFHSGAGLGLRWELPVGMVAFDVAKPITGEENSSFRVHIYMGMLL
jgi:translocation and assembly module TamA